MLVVAPSKEVILLVASPLRRTSTEAVRKITRNELLHDSVMCSERILHVSARLSSFEFDDPFQFVNERGYY